MTRGTAYTASVYVDLYGVSTSHQCLVTAVVYHCYEFYIVAVVKHCFCILRVSAVEQDRLRSVSYIGRHINKVAVEFKNYSKKIGTDDVSSRIASLVFDLDYKGSDMKSTNASL